MVVHALHIVQIVETKEVTGKIPRSKCALQGLSRACQVVPDSEHPCPVQNTHLPAQTFILSRFGSSAGLIIEPLLLPLLGIAGAEWVVKHP